MIHIMVDGQGWGYLQEDRNMKKYKDGERGTGYGERVRGTGTGTENGDRELGRGTRMGYNWKGNDCSCDR